MKMISLLLVCCAAFIHLTSCVKTKCISPSVTFYVGVPGPIPDTSMQIIRFTKGSNFSAALDTYISGVGAQFTGVDSDIVFTLPASGAANESIYSYDWMFIFRPSGKSYQLTRFAKSNSSMKTSWFSGGSDACTNSVSCYMNGSPCGVASQVCF